MKIKPLLLIIMLVLLSSLVLAVPPQSVIFSGDEGLELQYQNIQFTPLNQEGFAIVHVFNKSNGVLMLNDSVSCYAAVMDVDGSILSVRTSTFVNDYFLFNLSNTTINKTGFYGFTMHCNTSSLGGYLTSYFEATSDGLDPERGWNESTALAVILFVLLINIGVFLLGFRVDFIKASVGNLIIKRCFILLGVYLMMMNSAIMFNLANLAGLGINDFMIRYIWFFGWGGYLMMAYVALKTLVDALNMAKDVSTQQRMGDDDE